MAQIGFFLMERADGIALVWYGVTTILLLVTLHRIRQVRKLLRQIAEREAQSTLPDEDEKSSLSPVCEAVGELPEQGLGCEQNPQELIDAVLGEIFS